MIRVVLDTNVVVSAMLRSGGFPEAILNLCLAGRVQAYASEPILAEYEEVLRRPRLAIDPGKVTGALSAVREAVTMVNPTVRVFAALDPDDNMFLECVEAAQASYLVTGNRRHFPDRWGETMVVTPRHFIDEARWAEID